MPRQSTITPELVEQILFWKRDERSTREIAKRVHRSHSTIWRVLDRIKKDVSKQNVSNQSEHLSGRDLASEIDHYQPTMPSSFGGGKGAGTPPSVVKQIVKTNNPGKNPFELRKEEWNLRPYISAKDPDPQKHRLREHVVRRMEELGYDGSSDSDPSFGKLAEITSLGLIVLRNAKRDNIKLQTRKLADALIAYGLPQKGKELEKVEMTLLCPSKHCRGKPSASFQHKSGKGVVCARCHIFIPWSKVRLKPRKTKIDPEYYALVKRIDEESKSFGLGVEPGPLTSPSKARKHMGVCVNESTSQSSE